MKRPASQEERVSVGGYPGGPKGSNRCRRGPNRTEGWNGLGGGSYRKRTRPSSSPGRRRETSRFRTSSHTRRPTVPFAGAIRNVTKSSCSTAESGPSKQVLTRASQASRSPTGWSNKVERETESGGTTCFMAVSTGASFPSVSEALRTGDSSLPMSGSSTSTTAAKPKQRAETGTGVFGDAVGFFIGSPGNRATPPRASRLQVLLGNFPSNSSAPCGER